MRCFFVSDLHGRHSRYETLFARVRDERPDALFIGGDILPLPLVGNEVFIDSFLRPKLERLEEDLGESFPRIFVIPGNDDPRATFQMLERLERVSLLELIHERHVELEGLHVFGYACVPPTPFQLKDWERYDVGRYVEPGGVSPEEGRRTVEVDALSTKFGTIASDLERLTEGVEVRGSIWLFHSPPYQTALDRAALDGKSIDHVPLDVNVGSIAIRRFIEQNQPCLTMHGHIHESARLTGSWRDRIGETHLLGAAHDGPELALVRFDPAEPEAATRELIVG